MTMHDPIIGRHARIRGIIAKVVIGHCDGTIRPDTYIGYECLLIGHSIATWSLVDLDRRCPCKTTVGGHREGDLVYTAKARILPNHVKITVIGIHRDLWNATLRSNRPAGIGVSGS